MNLLSKWKPDIVIKWVIWVSVRTLQNDSSFVSTTIQTKRFNIIHVFWVSWLIHVQWIKVEISSFIDHEKSYAWWMDYISDQNRQHKKLRIDMQCVGLVWTSQKLRAVFPYHREIDYFFITEDTIFSSLFIL